MRSKSSIVSFLLHIHPRTVPRKSLAFTLSFGLGGMAITLILLLFFSGVLQLIAYTPEAEFAYHSIQKMYAEGSFSGFFRNIHFWSGNLLVIISFLHLLRVVFTGALDEKRRGNWLIGLILFGLVLFANFTGYLLPWDQLAYWATTIFLNMLQYVPLIGVYISQLLKGGDVVGDVTLSHFYGLHIALLPALLLFFILWHIWWVRKAGGLILADHQKGERVPVVPHLVCREAATGLGLMAAVLLFAVFFDAPLAEPANPAMSTNPAKGAWYFLGVQELLIHLHPQFAIFYFPLFAVGFLALLPYRPSHVLPAGFWFGSKKGLVCFGFVSVLSFVFTFGIVVIDDLFLRSNMQLEQTSSIFNRGLLPLFAVLTSCILLYKFLIKRWKLSQAEAVTSLFVLIVSAFLCLTIIGIWFRGEGMTLMF